MAGGKAAAYQRLQPLQGDISADILNNEDQEFRYRAEQREIADKKAKAKALKEKQKKEGLAKFKNIFVKDTGSESINAVYGEAVKIAESEYPKLYEILYDNPDKYSVSEKIDAQLKLDYLGSEKGFVSDLYKMGAGVLALNEDYTKKAGVHGGYFKDDKYERNFQNGAKGVSISLDDNLRPITLFRGTGEDTDNDGILDVETLDSLQEAFNKPRFQRYIDYDTSVNDFADRLVSAVNQTDNGVTRTKTTGVEPEMLTDKVNRFLYNEDGTPTAPMLSFIRLKGLDPTNKSHLDEIKKDFKNDVYLKTKRGKEVDVDGGTALANRKYKDEKKDKTDGVSFVESKQYGNAKEATANIYAFNSPYIIKGTSKSDRPKTLFEIRYDEENGNIALLGKEYKGKDFDEAMSNYEKAVDEQNKAYNAWVSFNGDDKEKANVLYGEYKAKEELAKVAKEKTTASKNSENWEDIVINDKATVTSILSKTMDVDSYEAIQKKLKRQEDPKTTSKKTIKGF